jgi:hypothetical protein
MRSARRRLLGLAGSGILALTGFSLLVVFLANQGLDRADKWMSVLGGLFGIGAGMAGLHRARPKRSRPPNARVVPLAHVTATVGGELLDRDDEVAVMHDFCLATDPPGYLWWQADAWAGKSALMIWFASHPPAGIEVVSAFVTARDVGQGTRAAFAGRMRAQLAELIGEAASAGDGLSEEELLRDLYRRAAAASRSRRKRMVLLVDGLDEDRGVTLAADSHSIARLLPDELPDSLRVIVASRPYPGVPWDVPDAHPLRSAIVKRLEVSPHATAAREDAERELRYLARDPADRRVLGLVAAAGGGLTLPDLAFLADVDDLGRRMETVTGRTFDIRASLLPGTGRPPSYVFAHEQLQRGAETEIGERVMSEHRARIVAWSDTYARRGWPGDTPEFLIVGLEEHLRQTRNLTTLLRLHTDPNRLGLLRRVTGAHQMTLTSMSDTLDSLAAEAVPDLLAMTRIALQRDALAERGARIPASLPAARVYLGEPDRAVELIRWSFFRHRGTSGGIGSLEEGKALVRLITALARQGYLSYAEKILRTIDEPYYRVRAAAAVIPHAGAARARQLAVEAEADLSKVEDPDWTARCAAKLARALHAVNDVGAATKILRIAEDIATRTEVYPVVLAELAWSTAVLRPGPLARQRASAAEVAARKIERTQAPDLMVLTRLMQAYLRLGDSDEIRRLCAEVTESMVSTSMIAEELADFAAVVATEVKDVALAHQLIDRLVEESADNSAHLTLAAAAEVSALIGDRERARQLADDAERLADTVGGAEYVLSGIAALAEAASRTGNRALTRTLLRRAKTIKAERTPSRFDDDHAYAKLAAAAFEIDDVPLGLQLSAPIGSANATAVFSKIKNIDGLDPSTIASLLTPLSLRADAVRHVILQRAVASGRHDFAAALGKPVEYARVLADAGEFAPAAEVLREEIRANPYRSEPVLALPELVIKAVRAGYRDEASGILAEIPRSENQLVVRVIGRRLGWAVAAANAALGDEGRADAAEQNARRLPRHDGTTAPSSREILTLADGWLACGRTDRGRSLVRAAIRANTVDISWRDLASAVVEIGDPEFARELFDLIPRTGRYQFDECLAGQPPWSMDDALLEELLDKNARTFGGVEALTTAIVAVLAAGQIERAHRLTQKVSLPAKQAEMSALIAEHAEPAAARQMIATCLRRGRWSIPLCALAAAGPDMIPTLVADFDAIYSGLRSQDED